MDYMDQSVACKKCGGQTSNIIIGICHSCASHADKMARKAAWDAKSSMEKALHHLESWANPQHMTFDRHDAAFVLGVVRTLAATLPAAPAPTASTLGQQVARAQAEMAKWPPELRASVRLQGGDAAAPTRATAEQEAEIDAAVKAGRIMFELGWDDPRPVTAPTYAKSQSKIIERALVGLRDGWATRKDADDALAILGSGFATAPTEQARELPPLPERDGDWAGDDWFTADSMKDYARAALAARQAPHAPKQGEAHQLMLAAGFQAHYNERDGIHSYVGFIENAERVLSARQAPDEDGNNYCRILTILGMEEEGDPVAEVQRLFDLVGHAPTEQPKGLPTLRVPITDDEMVALRRFDECARDGAGYDVGTDMMKALASIGLVRHLSAGRYEHTSFGLAVLSGEVARQSPDSRDAARWQFMMKAADNPEGPEATALDRLGNEEMEDHQLNSAQMADLVDRAMAALAQEKAQ